MSRKNIAIKRLVLRLLGGIDSLLQLLVPVDKQRLCYGSYPEYGDNSYYVYQRAVLTRDGLTHVWLLRHDFTIGDVIRDDFAKWCEQSGHTNNRLIVIKRRSLSGYWHFLRSYAAFHTHGIFPFSRVAFRRHNFALWHGMPIKAVGDLHKADPNPFPQFGNHYLATSAFFQYIVAACFATPADSVLVCGMPRCDVLRGMAQPNVTKAEIKERLGLSPDKKLVLWMPTFRTHSSRAAEMENGSGARTFLDDLPSWSLDAISNAAVANNCEVLVKLHGYDSLNASDFQFSQSALTLLKANDWLAEGIQLYELLAVADGLISDVSSVLIDYLVTERPVAVIGFDLATYTREVTFPVEWLLDSQAVHSLDAEETVAAFFESAAAGEGQSLLSNDLSRIFNEPVNEPGSEAVLRELGV